MIFAQILLWFFLILGVISLFSTINESKYISAREYGSRRIAKLKYNTNIIIINFIMLIAIIIALLSF